MSDIQQYGWSQWGNMLDPAGGWVRHADHVAALAAQATAHINALAALTQERDFLQQQVDDQATAHEAAKPTATRSRVTGDPWGRESAKPHLLCMACWTGEHSCEMPGRCTCRGCNFAAGVQAARDAVAALRPDKWEAYAATMAAIAAIDALRDSPHLDPCDCDDCKGKP